MATVRAIARYLMARPQRWLAVAALGAAAAMIPWTVSLGLTLPTRYVTENWDTTWVGFDIALTTGFVAIAATAWFRSRYLGPAATITATLLACDAWFDISTASAGDRGGSLLTALGELPIAAGLTYVVVRSIQRRRGIPPKVEPRA
jgi:hypothetical protein